MKQVISTKMAAAMYNPVSQATVAKNGMLYSAGMIGRSPETGEMHSTFEGQARQALLNLGALLREAGGTYDNFVHDSGRVTHTIIPNTISGGPSLSAV